jgi:hypothetical protein
MKPEIQSSKNLNSNITKIQIQTFQKILKNTNDIDNVVFYRSVTFQNEVYFI